MPAQLTPKNLAEIAAWMRRWRHPLPVEAETQPRLRVLAHQTAGVMVFEGDALRRLLPREG